MEPLMLCIAMDAGKLMRLSFLASALGIRLIAVDASQGGQTLGVLCGLDQKAEHAKPERIDAEMMVMAFFPEGLMERLLQSMRENGIAPVRLKAVLTPHNRAWTCRKLCRELLAEDAVIRGKRG